MMAGCEANAQSRESDFNVNAPSSASPFARMHRPPLMRLSKDNASRAGGPSIFELAVSDPAARRRLACDFVSSATFMDISPESLAARLDDPGTLRKLASLCDSGRAQQISNPRQLGELFADAGYDVNIPRLEDDRNNACDELISLLLQVRQVSLSTWERCHQPDIQLQLARSVSMQPQLLRRRPVLRTIRQRTFSCSGVSASLSAPQPKLPSDKNEYGAASPSGASISQTAAIPSLLAICSNTLIYLDANTPLVIGDCIDRGQFGAVHRAMNLKTGAILAVKRIELYEHSEEEISALMHEVALLEQLNSPFIVRYEGFARSDTHLSIATEYIEGGSLLNAIRTFGPFPEDLAALHAYSILEGLDYLHGQDIAHCDLKSANVLIAKDGHLHLSDFGISLRLGGQTTLRRAIRGTPNWLAPEIVTLRGTSKASDIWSFACTVLEMLQGTPPYANQNPMSVLYSIVERGCPPFPDGLSSDLTNLLKSCFAVEPRARPTAGELKKHPWFERSNGMAEKPLFKYSAGTPWTCFDDPMTIVPSRGEGGEFRGPRHGATLSLGTQSHAQDRTSDNSSSQLRPPTEKLLRCCPAYRVQIRRRASQRVVQECCVM